MPTRPRPTSRAQQKALQAEAPATAAAGRDPGARRESKEDRRLSRPSRQGCRPMPRRRKQMIQGGFLKAQQTIAQALEPILQGIMQQRGANMILDKNAVVYASPQAVRPSTSPSRDRAAESEIAVAEGDSGAAARAPALAEIRRRFARQRPWPIPASTTIAALSRWPRFARRRAWPCRRAPTARR